MRLFTLVLSTLFFLTMSCESKKATGSELFDITIKNIQKTYTPADNFKVSIVNKKSTTIDSLEYFFDSRRITSSNTNSDLTIHLKNEKLGNRSLEIKIYSGTTVYEVSKKNNSLVLHNTKIVYLPYFRGISS